jgi:hypothetical protein
MFFATVELHICTIGTYKSKYVCTYAFKVEESVNFQEFPIQETAAPLPKGLPDFFLEQLTWTGKNIPNDHKITKWA